MEAPTFGGRVRLAREAKSLSQAKLARLLGVSVTTLWRWEDDRMRPGLDTVERVADELDVSIDWLVRGDHVPTVDGSEATREVRS